MPPPHQREAFRDGPGSNRGCGPVLCSPVRVSCFATVRRPLGSSPRRSLCSPLRGESRRRRGGGSNRGRDNALTPSASLRSAPPPEGEARKEPRRRKRRALARPFTWRSAPPPEGEAKSRAAYSPSTTPFRVASSLRSGLPSIRSLSGVSNADPAFAHQVVGSNPMVKVAQVWSPSGSSSIDSPKS